MKPVNLKILPAHKNLYKITHAEVVNELTHYMKFLLKKQLFAWLKCSLPHLYHLCHAVTRLLSPYL